MSLVIREKVVQNLQRVLGAEGKALLRKFDLLKPLIKQMVIHEAIAEDVITEAQLEEARAHLLRQNGFSRVEQWPELIKQLGLTENEVLRRLRHETLRMRHVRKNFSSKAEAHFLERKNHLDRVVYSLLRLDNMYLARELYFQIESRECSFADLAKRYTKGPERKTNGIVGPISLAKAHPILAEKLRVAQPDTLLEPFQISDWWLIVRLEHFEPAAFTDEVSNQMCQDMFNAWINEETAASLRDLDKEAKNISNINNFNDIIISK